jgi:hypothetical protein
LKGGDNMEDRATNTLIGLRMAYRYLLGIGVPEDVIQQAITKKLVSISEEDPELFDEIAVTAMFENLLNE